jgi:hypothetical protein
MDTTAGGLLFLLLDGYHCWWTIIPIVGWIPLLVDYYSSCWMDTTASGLLFLLLDRYHCWWTIIPIAGWIQLLVNYYSQMVSATQ